jgi:hypothetical protein
MNIIIMFNTRFKSIKKPIESVEASVGRPQLLPSDALVPLAHHVRGVPRRLQLLRYRHLGRGQVRVIVIHTQS